MVSVFWRFDRQLQMKVDMSRWDRLHSTLTRHRLVLQKVTGGIPMLQRLAAFLALPMLAVSLYGQGLDTQATKDDWEEINFDYNSSVLVDGFPSLLRLSELLQKNAGYKVRIEGHTDTIGDTAYNNRLGLARASAVRDFLVKYGARPAQIEVSSRGKLNPKYAGQKDAYVRTDEARWMNRRVALTVLDDQGR